MRKSLQEIQRIVVVGFYGVVLIGQLIVWSLINYIGAWGKSIWFIIGTAVFMTIVSCSAYLLFRKLLQRFRGGTTLVEEIYEMVRTD